MVMWVVIGLMLVSTRPGTASHRPDLGVFLDQSSRIPFPLDSTTIVTDVELVDVNGDGDLDLWVSRGTLNGTGKCSQLWTNDGLGNFGVVVSSKGGGTCTTEAVDHTDAVFGDADGDNDMDVFESVNLAGERAKFNSGIGAFRARKSAFSDSTTDITISGVLFDPDKDGDLDFAEANECPPPACNAGGSQNSLWINDGAGNFRNETATRFPTRLDQSSALVPGDIDGDGDLDLIVVNGSPAGAQTFILINDGTGRFTDETVARMPLQLVSGRDAAVVDVDGDGDRDLLLVTSRQTQSRLYLNNGLGVFTEVTGTHLPVQLASFQEVRVIDTNGDGKVDFFYLSDTGRTIDGINHIFEGAQNRLWENSGLGIFTDITAAHFPAVIDASFSAAIGDVNGDGKFDVVVGNGKNQPIKIYIQN
jgi:hypothetical protein